MKNLNYYIALIFAVLLIAVSCKKTPVVSLHHDYFGMVEGEYVIYDVMEINHDQAAAIHDTLIYQLKTIWADTITDNQGREAREFHRYKRNTSQDPWVLTDVWMGLIDGVRGELVEENQRKVKLVFAPTLSKQWDANAYNMLGELDCYYRDIHQDTTINGFEMDPSLVVEQDDFVSLIDTVRKYEVYAKGVGLVYKHSKDNFYQFTTGSEVFLGTEQYYTYVSHGFQ